MARECTNWILEEIDEGVLDPKAVVLACLKYMSENDVRDMAHCNEFGWDEDTEEEEVE